MLTAGYEQRVDNEQYGTHGNGGISNIECREPLAADQEAEVVRHLDEIDDITESDAIDDIAERTTQNQRQTAWPADLKRHNQTAMTALTVTANAMKNHRCQPPASARKLKAAPGLRR